MTQSDVRRTDERPAAEDVGKQQDEAKAARESSEKPVSKPGAFANDPDDPTNPNEAIERHRRRLRPE
ncbi:MAG: hypothetical protein M3O06_05805 [Pseudomonadota bacterium]|nr:hypothetical protein [Pseudomonadota bacterium]